MYLSPEQIDNSVIDFLLQSYQEVVRIIEWKKFEIHYPFHYYGQLVMISDCIYKSIHEVEHLVMMHLDEMILPAKQENWADLVKVLEKKGKYASFSFLNRFFTGPSQNTSLQTSQENLSSSLIHLFKDNNVPPYFTKTQEVKCYFNHGAKTKLIIKPLHLVRGTVHQACEGVKHYQPAYHVPPYYGINAHYREESIPDCKSRPTIKNLIAMKLANQYTERFHNFSRA